jgi:hypothetical protein
MFGIGKSKGKWAKLAKQVEALDKLIKKRFIEEKWPTDTYVRKYDSPIYASNFEVYDEKKEYPSIESYFGNGKSTAWFWDGRKPFFSFYKLHRDENGKPSLGEELFVLGYKNIDELRSTQRYVIEDGPRVGYPVIYTAYETLRNIIKNFNSMLYKNNIGDYYSYKTPSGYTIAVFDEVPDNFYFMDGTKFNGDVIDLSIAFNSSNLKLKSIKEAIDELNERKKAIDKEASGIISTFKVTSPKLETDKLYSEL